MEENPYTLRKCGEAKASLPSLPASAAADWEKVVVEGKVTKKERKIYLNHPWLFLMQQQIQKSLKPHYSRLLVIRTCNCKIKLQFNKKACKEISCIFCLSNMTIQLDLEAWQSNIST